MAQSHAATDCCNDAPPVRGAPVSARRPVPRGWGEVTYLLAAASPIVLIGMLNMAMSIADVVMLGRYDAEGLAAIVIVSDLYSIVFNFSAGFAGVVTPQVAAAIGARVRWQVCTIVRRTLLLCLVVGGAGVLLLVAGGRAAGILGAHRPGAVAAYAACMAGTYLFMLLFALARAVLSAIGRPAVALLIIIAALPAKVAANYALIYGAWGAPELGTTGAGLSSLLVSALMGSFLLAYVFRGRSRAEFDGPPPVPHSSPPMLAALARSGLLLGLIAVAETGAFLASTIVVGLFAPQDLIAHVLAFRSLAVLYLMVAGVGQAVTIRMAYLHGRAAVGLQAHAARAVACCSLALVVLILGFLVACAGPLARFLVAAVQADSDVSSSVAGLLPVAGITLAALVPAHMITAFLRARDDVAVPTGLTVMSYWGIALTAMLLLADAGLGARAIWCSLLAGALVSSASISLHLVRRFPAAAGPRVF